MSVYVYRVLDVVNIVDGTTYDLVLDVGFHQCMAARFTLNGYDVEDKRGVEAWLKGYTFDGTTVHARTHKTDSFGHWAVDLFVEDDDLGGFLHEHGLATRWTGGEEGQS